MFGEITKFLKRHSSVIITTHDWPDADGLGAEIAFSYICKKTGVNCRIFNSRKMPERYQFMDPEKEIKTWDNSLNAVELQKLGLVILDSSDEYNIGGMKELIPAVNEVFMIDHHDHAPSPGIKSIIDSTASSTCELMAEFAEASGYSLDLVSSSAVFAGISYDTGSFAFPKTTARTFRIIVKLVEAGVNPYLIHHELNETAETGTLLLHQRVFSTLKILNNNRIAVQVLRKEDLEITHTNIEDAETFINVPLKSKDIMVSVLAKDTGEGQIRCSLRSKGEINVSQIAQIFGGGGHATASGFRSSLSVEETLERVLEKINIALENR